MRHESYSHLWITLCTTKRSFPLSAQITCFRGQNKKDDIRYVVLYMHLLFGYSQNKEWVYLALFTDCGFMTVAGVYDRRVWKSQQPL
jgi:hypothetical protein